MNSTTFKSQAVGGKSAVARFAFAGLNFDVVIFTWFPLWLNKLSIQALETHV